MSNMMGAPGSDNLLNMENGADKQHRAALHRTALYREWRPRAFRDVVEQGHVVTTLKNSIKQNGLAHAYLFCGTRGTGKTTLAQILSRAVNCLDPSDSEPCNECEICKGILSGRILDVAEIDAASNNSVDNIRNLRDLINYAPAQAKYKVYIIDEVHMLSGGAFNALLKTLEEPPSYVIFILATTEPHKLPATIVSRCQRFDFRRITDGAIIGRLALIAGEMGVAADPGALRMIARLSDGALRDAISIFDQCVSSKGRALQSDVSMDNALLTLDDVLRITGRPGDDYLMQCARILVGRELKSVPMHVAAISAAGMNLIQYIDGMATFFKDLMMLKMGHGRDMFADMQDGIYKEARALAERCDMDMLLAIASEFASLPSSIKDSSNQSVLLEVALAKICLRRFHADNAVEALNARIGELEKQMESLAQRIGSGAAGGSVGDAADSVVGVAAYGSVGDAAGDAIGDEVDYAADVIEDYTVGDVAGDGVDYLASDG
ncbi:MAG: DNA polymerase III subunit gamma/tau, partial [Oscillospiraceae bacterium]|nr:DNA polymerase III subunit gamma/tau [Oscillospiraceae bacterium]